MDVDRRINSPNPSGRPYAGKPSFQGATHMSDRVTIFDTTLRDGEQSCGCSMNVPEKLRMARKLVELGVDVMEAGFPAASEGDLEAVDASAGSTATSAWPPWPAVTRATSRRRPGRWPTPSGPRIHTFIATSPIHLKHKLKKTADEALEIAVKAIEQARSYVDDVEFSAEDATRTSLDVLLQLRRGGGGGGRHHGQPARHGRVHHAGRDGRSHRQGQPGPRRPGGRQRPLPRRPGPGGGQLAGRRPGGRPPDRVHHQRHRRAGRQLLARGGGHGHGGPQGRLRLRRPASAPSSCTPPAGCWRS